MNVKDSEIILCKGIKLDKEFENVLSYSESDMVTLCRNNQIATSNSYSILDPTVNSIDVSLPYASCIYANYIAFKNPHYGNKWFFGFVNKVKYISNKSVTIEYKLDVFSTWYSSFNVGKAFIEREHVSDDTIGLHTVKEGLNTGDFIINGQGMLDNNSDGVVVIGVTKVPEDMNDLQLVPSSTTYTAPTTVYNGIFSGLTYYAFWTPYSASQFLMIMDLKGMADDVVSVFIAPNSLLGLTQYDYLYYPYEIYWPVGVVDPLINVALNLSFFYCRIPTSNLATIMADGVTVPINVTLDSYIPKNNKMFTKEFNYLYVTNNNGDDIEYAYEDFSANTPKFRIIGSLSPGCSIRLTPLDYKKYDTSVIGKNDLLPFGLVGGKFPTCSWRSDTYTNYITQQSVNNVKNVVGGVIGAAVGATINPAGTISSGINSIFNALADTDAGESKKYPMQARGNVNVSDVTYSIGQTNFSYFQMSCRSEFAKICDDYLSRYGYKVNEIKTPNLNSRTKFNYIKVGGTDELISGDIPASDLEEINNIFRKGVTIFHDYSSFGDYTATNSIVTPTP